jgi:predicted nuclease of predicted toxin-antitoxin system
MRILLDECLPTSLKRDITDHQVATVVEMGWSGMKNGRLLTIAETYFDILLTVDKGIEYQQNLESRQIAVAILDAPNKVRLLRLLMPALLKALPDIQSGSIVHIGSEK